MRELKRVHLCLVVVVTSCLAAPTTCRSQTANTAQTTDLAKRDKLFEEAAKHASDGRYQDAITIALQVLELQQGLFDESDEEIAVHKWIQLLYLSAHRIEEAAQTAQEIHRISKAVHGATAWQTVSAKYESDYIQKVAETDEATRKTLLGIQDEYNELMQSEQYAAAAESMLRLASHEEKLLGETHPNLAVTFEFAADAWLRVGEVERGVAAWNQCLTIRRASFGAQHPDTAKAFFSLGELGQRRGDHTAAIKHYVSAADAYQSLVMIAETGQCYAALGICWRNRNDRAAAAKSFEHAAACFAQIDDDMEATRNHWNCGIELLALGRPNVALEHFQHVETATRKADQALDLAWALYWQGNALRDAAKSEDALVTYEKAIDAFGEIQEHQGVAETNKVMAKLLTRMKRFADARDAFLSCRATYEQLDRVKDVQTAEESVRDVYNKWYGEIVKGSDAKLAVSMLRQRLQFERKTAESDLIVSVILMQLAIVYERALEDFAAAADAHAQRLTVVQRFREDGHPQIADAQFALGHVRRLAGLTNEQLEIRKKASRFAKHAVELTDAKKYDEAEAKMRECIDLYHSVLGDASPEYAINLGTLAVFYMKINQPDKAEPYYVRSAETTKKQRGANHANYGYALRLLASFYLQTKQPRRAVDSYRDVIDIYQGAGIDQGRDYHRLVESYCTAVRSLYIRHLEQLEFAAAKSRLKDIHAIKKATHGEHDWRVTEARAFLDHFDEIEALSEPDLTQLLEAIAIYDPISISVSADRPDISVIRRSVEMRQRVLGSEHPENFMSMKGLATATAELGLEEALKRSEDVESLANTLYGKQHPYAVATQLQRVQLQLARNDYDIARELILQAVEVFAGLEDEYPGGQIGGVILLGEIAQQSGDYEQALRHYRHAMQLNRSLVSRGRGDSVFTNFEYLSAARNDTNPYHVPILRGLASAQEQSGNLRSAAMYRTQIAELLARTRGKSTLAYAVAIHNLGGVHLAMGDYQRAEALYTEALAIREEKSGTDPAATAVLLNNLGRLYFMMGHAQRAEETLRRALEVITAEEGYKSSRDYGVCMDNLGLALVSLEKYDEAEATYREAVACKRVAYGSNHSMFGISLMNQAGLYRRLGRLDDAKQQLLDACSIFEQSVGKGHREYRNAQFSLAKLYWQQDDLAKAEATLRQVVDSSMAEVSETARGQSERQQLASVESFRYQLDHLISLTHTLDRDPASVCDQILAWKGTVLRRQQWVNRLRNHEELESKVNILDIVRGEDGRQYAITENDSGKFIQLENINRRIARLALGLPSDVGSEEQRMKLLRALADRKEQLEGELAATVAELESSAASPVQQVTSQELREGLPPDTALIDVLQYLHSEPAQESSNWASEWRLVAMVMQKDKPVVRVELGASSSLQKAVDTWRAALLTGDAYESGRVIRDQIWSPISRAVPDAKILLVSPDGPLTRIPLAALPGSKKGSYLIEEITIANVAAPQLLPEILADRTPVEPLPGRVLAIGGVDYNDSSPTVDPEANGVDRAATSGDEAFLPLAGTQEEIDGIRQLYMQRYGQAGLQTLEGEHATEDDFRREAPQHPILHLATHGFFAADRFRTSLNTAVIPAQSNVEFQSDQNIDDYYPALLSGIVLAGANHPDPTHQDGILTAEEVAALDLSRVDLTLLSACETGLGRQVTGGEGLLSLQRAFRIAGARTVISTMWKVPDKGTQALVSEFYRNLWQEKMGKLEALRQAQISMLYRYDASTGTIQDRGVTIKRDKRTVASAKGTPPYYWGAFILNGDWR